MPRPPPRQAADPGDRYHGFSLARVGWGHRALFEQAIEGLLARGLIGPSRRRVTETFFGLLRHADQGPYDYVLRRFLESINPRTEWLLDLPELFADVVELGRDLAASQPHRGVVYFETLSAGGLGSTPAAVTQAVVLGRRLARVDPELGLALLRGYGRLSARLQPQDLERFAEAALSAFGRPAGSGLAFAEGTSESAEALIAELAHECRLEDIRESLCGLLAALANRPVGLADLSALPAPPGRATRGSICRCFADTLYLPASVRRSEQRERNRSWYTLATVTAAGSFRFGGFSQVHGHRDFPSLAALAIRDTPLALNALVLAEWQRLLARCGAAWPGLARLQRYWLEQDLRAGGTRWPEAVGRLLLGGEVPSALDQLRALADGAASAIRLAAAVDDRLLAELAAQCPELAQGPLPALSFVPDARFPAPPAVRPGDLAPAALRGVGVAVVSSQSAVASPLARDAAKDALPETPETEADDAAAFVYDEWDRGQHGYRREFCRVHETVPEASGSAALPPELAAEIGRIRRAFERAKPDAPRRERYLHDGDEISADRLVHFLMQRGTDPSPRVDFYEKPRTARRDPAVLILLDVSGSAAEATAAGETVLDVERHAALVLGQGLAALGDPFAVCGFCSAGPRNCSFLVFKDFRERWGDAAMARLAGASPARNTRIGPALRHAGWRVGQVACRQRLILLVTDGRPLDSDYDPATHYAHADVRKACEENANRGIRTFGVCTDPRRNADMELMFPGRRFVILPDIGQLARALPTLYSRLTL